MVKKKVKKRKVVKRKSKEKHSPLLKLEGKPSADIEKLLKRVQKNIPEPARWGGKGEEWDHLISALDKGDAFPLEHKIAGSVANRLKKLGYVVRLKRLDKDFTQLWFGGFQGVSKKSKRRVGSN